MKISQKQASLLAKEIVERLKKVRSIDVSPAQKQKLEVFKTKQNKLREDIQKAQDILEKHNEQFDGLVEGISNVYSNDSLQRILQKIAQKNTPSVSEIEDRIILKSMFADANDMEAFVQTIIKDYSTSKKLRVS